MHRKTRKMKSGSQDVDGMVYAYMNSRRRQMRSQRGSLIAIGLGLLFVLIPLGLVVFDLTLMRQQYNQLKAATDAAALSAAVWAADSENSSGDNATISANAQKIALPYFRGNRLSTGLYEGSLENAESASSDPTPETLSTLGQSKLFVTVDKDARRTTAYGAFCIRPSLLSFFGLYTLHTKSVVGPGSKTGKAGDVCFVLDLSASMCLSTPRSRNVVAVAPVPRRARPEKRISATPNLIKRFAVPGAIELRGGDPEADATPNRVIKRAGVGVHPFGSAGFVSFRNGQIPNPHYIDFVPNPNPNNYHPAGTPPKSSIPNSSAPTMKIDPQGTPLLYALMNDFASNKIDVPIPADVHYPQFPKWPPVNPSKPFTYFDARGAAAPPGSAELEAGKSYDGSDLNKLPYDFRTPVRIKTFTAYTIPEIMTLVLLAAKRGLLEDKATFDAAPPEATFALKQYFPNLGTDKVKFTRGYQREYNRLALTTIQPVEAQVAIMHDVIDTVQKTSPDAHWSLVVFNAFAAGLKDNKPPSNEQSPSPGNDLRPYDWKLLRKNGKKQTAEFYQNPLVPLDGGRTNAADVLQVIDETTLRYGTATPQGLKEGISQLTGPGSRSDKNKTMVLMTDGIPTQGGSLGVVRPNKKKNYEGLGKINLVIVGLFESNYACPGGPRFCARLAKAAGANATVYPVNRMSKNCGKVAGDPSIDFSADALGISKFIVDNIAGGGGDLGLIE